MFIYVVESIGAIKVGITSNLSSRLASLQTGSPHRLKLVYSKEIGDKAPSVERKTHFLLGQSRMSGEWFSCSVTEATNAIEVAVFDPVIPEPNPPSSYYIAIIGKSDGSDYGVSFPDFPGLISAGATIDEAWAMAEEALALHLNGMEQDGEAIPEPSSLEQIMADKENTDAVAVLIPAPPVSTRSVRVNITMPADVLDQIDARAEQEGFTRSGFLAQAARKALAA
jgi:predicted RNase H-like HicB family nuclease